MTFFIYNLEIIWFKKFKNARYEDVSEMSSINVKIFFYKFWKFSFDSNESSRMRQIIFSRYSIHV